MKSITLAAAIAAVCPAFADITSSPTTVFLRPAESSFWHTAPGSTVQVPIDWPDDATAATLTVAGCNYSASYNVTSGDMFALTLPTPVSPAIENVYDLTLTFNNTPATVRKAKLGLIEGLLPGAAGTSRCIGPKTSPKWGRVYGGRAVMPIPYGTTSLTVNGVATDTGLGGDQGWFALDGLEPGEGVELSLTAGQETFTASLAGRAYGLLFFCR